jgi:hypothetical protein
MLLRKSLSITISLIIITLTIASGSPVLRVGVDYRTPKTHFSDYSSYYYDNFGYSTINTWESYTLIGARGDLLWDRRLTDKIDIGYGIGIGLFFMNNYKWEVGSSDGSGDAGMSFEIDVPVRFSYPLSGNFTPFGRVGLSALFLNASQPDVGPEGSYGNWFYDEDFSTSLQDIYLGLGTDYAFSSAWTLSFMLRFSLIGIGASTDYGMDPSNEGFSDFGISARFVKEFGR